jgi:hypothetical protein
MASREPGAQVAGRAEVTANPYGSPYDEMSWQELTEGAVDAVVAAKSGRAGSPGRELAMHAFDHCEAELSLRWAIVYGGCGMRPGAMADFEIRRELETAEGDRRAALERELASRKTYRARIGPGGPSGVPPSATGERPRALIRPSTCPFYPGRPCDPASSCNPGPAYYV